MMKRNELVISGTRNVIHELFNVLRTNGIEPTIPVQSEKNFVMCCIQGGALNRILMSWKEFIECEVVTIVTE
jgi:hypothetical protein